MSQVITFSVPFVKAKQRPRMTRYGKVYTPKATHDAETDIAAEYKRACLRDIGYVPKPWLASVKLQVDTFRPLPKSREYLGAEVDTLKPDADNILKLVGDALNGVAYKDDSQVIEATVTKHPRERGQSEKTLIRVELMYNPLVERI